MKNKLRVSELFYSIQGEGFTMGRPSVFIRLAGCNLLCRGEWECDTIEVWRNGTMREIPDVIKEVKDYIGDNSSSSSIVITGGEPLQQQASIKDFISLYSSMHQEIPWVEVETNGTILPHLAGELIDQFNCSPKLPNSGNPEGMFYNQEVLHYLAEQNTFFKFVVSKPEDIKDIHKYYGKYINKLGKFRTYLMPACETREDFYENAPMVIELCKEYGYSFSSRIQLTAYDKKTGV